MPLRTPSRVAAAHAAAPVPPPPITPMKANCDPPVNIKALIRPPAKLIPAMAQLTIDESTATATAQVDHDERVRGFWTAGLGVWLTWNTFTLIGALAGDAMGDPQQWGLDGAAVAAFLGLLWPRLSSKDPIAIAVVAALVTMIAIPLVPPGIPVLIAAAVTAAIWAIRRRRTRVAA